MKDYVSFRGCGCGVWIPTSVGSRKLKFKIGRLQKDKATDLAKFRINSCVFGLFPYIFWGRQYFEKDRYIYFWKSTPNCDYDLKFKNMSSNCPGTALDNSGWRGDSVDGVASRIQRYKSDPTVVEYPLKSNTLLSSILFTFNNNNFL